MAEETKALQMRFPVYLYNLIQERAEKTRRSFNSEVLVCLEDYFSFTPRVTMTIKEAAEYLHMSVKELKAMVEKGEISYRKLSDRISVFLPEDIDEYLAKIEVPPFTKPSGRLHVEETETSKRKTAVG